MADHSITISNRLAMFGMGEANLWNEFLWGSFYWGDNPDLAMAAMHLITNTATLDSSVSKRLTRLIEESVLTDTSNSKHITTYIDVQQTLDISLGGDSPEQYLGDSAGYRYVFPDRVSNAELRASNTYTSGTAGSTTWTEDTEPDDEWSET